MTTREYIRTLSFVLEAAAARVFPEGLLVYDYALPSGLYCELRSLDVPEGGTRRRVLRLGPADLRRLEEKMLEMVAAQLPITSEMLRTEDAARIFEAQHQTARASLLRSTGSEYTRVYFLDGYAGLAYASLSVSTAGADRFRLLPFSEGFCLRYPDAATGILRPVRPQAKLAAAFKAHSEWCASLGIDGIGALNAWIDGGRGIELINLCEARHERMYAEVANLIYQRRDTVKIVFIAGPSSSGKTSTSLRLAQQCRVLGLVPRVIELDNYFVDREKTPRDEAGNYDFESLGAMDTDLLGRQLGELLAGMTVEIPRFDFKQGRSVRNSGHWLSLGEKDILIMEGIHALNPAMVETVDDSHIMRIYASALTSLNIDEYLNISTTDNRLLRRLLRDQRTRGTSPEDTLLRWDSVRAGEDRNIFPFQEHADVFVNTALIYELPLLKHFVEPFLRAIPDTSAAWPRAQRLLNFLSCVHPLSEREIAAVPPTSILREFIGGQTL